MTRTAIRLTTLLAAGSLVVFSCIAMAQPYPAKPIKLIVPYPAGGVVDAMGRVIAERISASWSQQVIVDPKPGANGMIGTEAVLNAPADGYTWLLASQSHVANGAIYPNLRWDPAGDFAAAGRFAKALNYFVVAVSLPVNSVQEYVALAKAQPGQLNYGNPGNGTPSHLGFELFKRTAGIEVQSIGYKGNPPLLADLITGRISSTMLTAVLTTTQAKIGKIKPLAVLDTKRSKAFPDVPTIGEAGYGDVQVVSWFGVLLPAKAPREVIKRVADEVEKAVKSPEMIDRLEKIGAEPSFLGAQEFDAQIRKELALFKRVVKEAGIKPE